MLIEHPVRGWQRISVKRVLALHQGRESVIEFANKTVRIADAYVSADGNKLLGLQALRLHELRFDEQGRADQKLILERIQEKLNADPDKQMEAVTDNVSDDVRRAVLRCLGLSEHGGKVRSDGSIGYSRG